MRSPAARCWTWLLLGILLSVPSGCARGPDRLSGITAAFSTDGALHLAARLRTGSGEGGSWGHIAFLYARRDKAGAVIHFEPSATASVGSDCDDLQQLLIEGAAAQYLFFETGLALSLWLDRGNGWTQLGIDANVEAEARQTSGQHLRAAWRDQDALRLLTDRWLYRIEGAQIVDAMAVSGTCASTRLCYVAPESASAETEAVTLGVASALLSRLSCDAGQRQCTWTETGSTLGTGDVGGTSCRGGRFFFHANDAGGAPTPVFVRNVRPASGATYQVLANTPGGELEIVAQNNYFLGAAALPAGGYAVAVEDYDEELRLVLVAPDLTTKQVVELGRQPDGFMSCSLTVLGSGASSADQRVHIIFGVGVSTVRHLTIEPASGAIEGDELIDLRG